MNVPLGESSARTPVVSIKNSSPKQAFGKRDFFIARGGVVFFLFSLFCFYITDFFLFALTEKIRELFNKYVTYT